MVGVALLGAGIFAKTEHLPAIQAAKGLELKAIYSRSKASAESLAESVPSDVEIYYDQPSEDGRGLDVLLARRDVEAVVVALPITVQAAVIEKCFKAAKHILSEKPIAENVERAKKLIDMYAGLYEQAGLVWGVAENYRFMKIIVVAGECVEKLGGDLVSFAFDMSTLVNVDNKYYNTAWRKTPEYQGGFLLDGGVHFIAMIRHILAATNSKIKTLQSRTTLLEPRLAPFDTLHGLLTTQNDRTGTISVSFGTAARSGLSFRITTTTGELIMTPVDITVKLIGEEPQTLALPKETGVATEVAEWAAWVNRGPAVPGLSPREALKDLVILEGLLEGGETGRLVDLEE